VRLAWGRLGDGVWGRRGDDVGTVGTAWGRRGDGLGKSSLFNTSGSHTAAWVHAKKHAKIEKHAKIKTVPRNLEREPILLFVSATS